MTNGGIHQPFALTHPIEFAYSRLPGCTDLAFLRLLRRITTIDAVIIPIMKPVSLKLCRSSCQIPYLAIMLRAARKQPRTLLNEERATVHFDTESIRDSFDVLTRNRLV